MGSRLAWIIAGVIGVVLAGIIIKIAIFPSPTPPTCATTAVGMLDLQTPSKPLTLILPANPNGDGDAGDDYHKAIEAYKANREGIEKVLEHYEQVLQDKYRLTDDDVALLKKVADPIRAGSAKRQMTYYFRLTPKKIEIPYWPKVVDDFQEISYVPKMLFAHYFSLGRETYPQAEKFLLDILILGQHMIDERARLDIIRAGIGLEKEACGALLTLYQKWQRPDRVEAVKEYLDGLETISSVYSDLYKTIWRFDPEMHGPHPGDIFNLVVNHADRAVRVEAILALGVVKLTCSSRGDRRMVRKLIREKLQSEDPIERAAAKCAQSLDREGLNRLASSVWK